ncbi:LTA synthase family protein [Legionella bozemanae]|nr:sulfatase-like hydrolase/transferase [Legionella bozemanae]
MSLLLHYYLGLLYSAASEKIKYILAFLYAILFAFMIYVNYFLIKFTGLYFDKDALQFIKKDPAYLSDYLHTFVLGRYGVLLFVLFVVLFIIWHPKKNSSRGTISLKKTITLPLLYFISLNIITGFNKEYKLPIDTSTFVTLGDIYAVSNKPVFHSSHRTKISKGLPHKAISPNVLLIINESWGKTKGLPFYGHSTNAMPNLTNWIKDEKNSFFIFKNAHTNSTQTDISITSMLTGVSPEESVFKLHNMPLAWQWAKSAGYQTFFLSSQRLSWCHLDQFFFTKELDNHVTLENLNAPVINDMGCDDLIAVEQLPELLNSRDPSKPFFGVFLSNALHAPFQQNSNLLTTTPSFKSKYNNAQFILDTAITNIIQNLKKRDHLKNTIVVITADHGEVEHPMHLKAARLYSFYNEYFSIPFLIYMPQNWAKQHPQLINNLISNLDTNVSNLDVIPSLIDLFNPKLKQNNKKIISQMKGKSLFQVIPKNRFIIGVNSGDRNSWHVDGFGIAYQSKRFVYSTLTGAQYFDISTDPNELQDIWRNTDEQEKEKILSLVQSTYHLERIYRPTYLSRYHLWLRLKDWWSKSSTA